MKPVIKYGLMSFLLFFLICLDAIFTFAGMNLGFAEGNPFFVYFFEIFGIKLTLIFTLTICLVIILLLNFLIYKAHILKREKKIKFINRIYWFVIILKLVIVSVWFGMITAFLHYKAVGVC
jgi:uncharacterized protein DUF5658